MSTLIPDDLDGVIVVQLAEALELVAVSVGYLSARVENGEMIASFVQQARTKLAPVLGGPLPEIEAIADAVTLTERHKVNLDRAAATYQDGLRKLGGAITKIVAAQPAPHTMPHELRQAIHEAEALVRDWPFADPKLVRPPAVTLEESDR